MSDLTEHAFVIVDPETGKIDPSLYDSEGAGIPDGLIDPETERIRRDLMPHDVVYTVFPGLIPEENLPSNIVRTDGGKLPVSIMPFGPSGYPRSVDFGFAGSLAVRTGLFLWRTPPFAAVRPRAFTITLGTMPTVGGTGALTFVLNANGTEISRLTVPSGQDAAQTLAFTPANQTFEPSTLISVDVVSVPTSSPTAAGDALVQFWWEYVD